MYIILISYTVMLLAGGQGGPLAHPEFGSSFDPIKTRGADYVRCITASPRGLENLVASLNYISTTAGPEGLGVHGLQMHTQFLAEILKHIVHR